VQNMTEAHRCHRYFVNDTSTVLMLINLEVLNCTFKTPKLLPGPQNLARPCYNKYFGEGALSRKELRLLCRLFDGMAPISYLYKIIT
jgi:hypothetical protein